MKKNIHFSSKLNEWETPQHFFDKLNDEFNFELDAAASPNNAKCKRYMTIEDDALNNEWLANKVWLNPPYGREINKWIKKAYEESTKGVTVVCLIPARTDTKYWHEYIFPYATDIRFVKGRLKFNNHKNAAPFPSAVVIFGGSEG